jgi:hypothetical protein
MKGGTKMHGDGSLRRGLLDQAVERPAERAAGDDALQPAAQTGYEPPVLGAATSLATKTLFSGAVDPDAGTIEFGD